MSSEDPAQGDELAAQQQAGSRNSTSPVKCAYVCPNGSRYGKVRKVVIPARLRSRWEGVLQLIDDSIPIFGGCFNLVKVGDNGEYAKVKEFDEIEDNELYVAMNQSERLIKMDYKSLMNVSRSPSPPRRSQQSTASRTPRHRPKNEAESKFQKCPPRIIIKVYANDIYNKPPQRATLEQPDVYERRANVFKNKVVSAMEFVFRDIEECSGMTLKGNQSIRKMVDIRNGKIIEVPSEIEPGQTYVMCGYEDYREFALQSKIVRPFQCGRFSHERQRFLNNPRSAKVKGGNSSRKQKGQETSRDTARDAKSDRSGRESENHHNGYDSHQGYNYHENEDHYGNETSRQNGYHDHENGHHDQGDEFSQQNQRDTEEDEHNNIPRFGDADAPLLTDRKTSEPQKEKSKKEEESSTENVDNIENTGEETTEKPQEEKDPVEDSEDFEEKKEPEPEKSRPQEKEKEEEKPAEEVVTEENTEPEVSQAAEQNDSTNDGPEQQQTPQNNDNVQSPNDVNGLEGNDRPGDEVQEGQGSQ